MKLTYKNANLQISRERAHPEYKEHIPKLYWAAFDPTAGCVICHGFGGGSEQEIMENMKKSVDNYRAGATVNS